MIEMIASTFSDALAIEAGGAHRIELVAALSSGGLTPSYGLIETVMKAVTIPVNVMIRPHSMSFVYTKAELEIMKCDIEVARKLGANGVVLGVLTKDKQVDFGKLEDLLSVCDGLDVTFHRAIDETDVVASTCALAKYQRVTTILTSGGLKVSLEENVDLINRMIEVAGHINILVGGGLKGDNVKHVVAKTKTSDYHLGRAVQDNGRVCTKKVKALMNEVEAILADCHI